MCLTSDLTSPVNHWMTESSHRSCFTWVQCSYSFALLSGWESRTCASESSQKTAQYHLSQSLQSSSSSSSSSFWAPAHHTHTQHNTGCSIWGPAARGSVRCPWRHHASYPGSARDKVVQTAQRNEERASKNVFKYSQISLRLFLFVLFSYLNANITSTEERI